MRSLHHTIFSAVTAILLIAASANAYSQSNFKVLAVRGAVTNGKGGQITIGQKIDTKDKLTVKGSGYVSLAHSNGKTVEIRKAGTYAVKELEAKASKSGSSASSKYAKYVVNELTEVKEPINFSDTRRSHMRTTGSVDRAAGNDVSFWDSVLNVVGAPGELQALAAKDADAVASGDLLAVIMPRHTRLLDDSVAFVWHKSPKATQYKVVILSRQDAVVHSFVTSDTVYIASVASLGLQMGELYYWHLESASDPGYHTDEYALYALAGDERSTTEALVGDVMAEYDAGEEAIGKLILAAAFEDMGLFYDAHKAYKHAIELAPDIQNYKRLYAEFLQRQGLNSDAYAAYK